jgi:lambda repressor-like predicted transcriptional regulator
VGESKVEQAIEKALTKAEKRTAAALDVDPKDIDRTLQNAVRQM